MVLPAALPWLVPGLIGGNILVGLAGLWQSEKARGQASKKTGDIEKLYRELAAQVPSFQLPISAPLGMMQMALQRPEVARELMSPEFEFTAYRPEMYHAVQTVAPHLARLIKEEAPAELKRTYEMERGTKAQLHALDELERVAKGGFNPVFQEKVNEATRKTQQNAKQHAHAINQNFRQRGIHNSGLEFASLLHAGEESRNASAIAGEKAASDAYRHQLDALARSGEVGHKLYGQQETTQSKIKDAIDRFNARTAVRGQNVENGNTDIFNSAGIRGEERQQRAQDANIAERNAAAKYNPANRNAVRGLKEDYARQAEKAVNDALQQTFSNRVATTGGQAGAVGASAQNIIGGAQDRNAALSGLGSGLTQTGMWLGNRADAQAQQQQQAEQTNRILGILERNGGGQSTLPSPGINQSYGQAGAYQPLANSNGRWGNLNNEDDYSTYAAP